MVIMGKKHYLTVEGLDESQWEEIKHIAFKIYKSGQFSKDSFKCQIAGFVQWIGMQEEQFAIGIDETHNVH